jgi:hypothetical protein
MAGPRRRAPPKDEPEYRPGQLLDWRDSSHWSWEPGSPAHKVHAEDALARQAAEAADAYQQNGHTP